MKLYCCGLVYSTKDPQTYWCIRKDIIKNALKPFVEGKRIVKEVVYTLVCKKNGCTKVEIHSYADFEETHLINTETLSGKKALNFLKSTSRIRTPQPVKCPYQTVPLSKKVPYVYGKTIDGQTQRARYLTEEDWASRELIHSPVKIINEII